MEPEEAEVKAAGGVVRREDGHDRRRAPPALRRLVAAQGQARPGRELGGGALREVWEETGLRCALGEELSADVLRRPQGPREGRPLLADGADGRRASSPTTRSTSCAGCRPPRPPQLLTYEHDVELAEEVADL